MPPLLSSRVSFGPHVGIAGRIAGLPLESGDEHRRVSLEEVDAELLAAIQGSDPHDVVVTIVSEDGVEYTLQRCEAIALSARSASVELAVGLVSSVRQLR